MHTTATSPKEYLAQLPSDRKIAMQALRQVILENLPAGFEETMSYGMIGYVVPYTRQATTALRSCRCLLSALPPKKTL